ncbi:SPOR domain-containing protein [Microbacterium tenebrionis]|uniref:SPOR domain-containing protein n=1 Tax=Microbacterium tenebrionis TaxID=2830665 RepID=UPI00202AF88B|nr:SPOR domain-containing protein [Microbacterium ihumii]
MTRGEDSYMSSGERKYWYNTTSGEVEYGYISPSVDRVGPFDTAEAAANAMQTLRERSEAWAVEERLDDDWRKATDVDGK